MQHLKHLTAFLAILCRFCRFYGALQSFLGVCNAWSLDSLCKLLNNTKIFPKIPQKMVRKVTPKHISFRNTRSKFISCKSILRNTNIPNMNGFLGNFNRIFSNCVIWPVSCAFIITPCSDTANGTFRR